MRYFATSFSLTLGAWRLRLRLDLDDAPDEMPLRPPGARDVPAREMSATSR